MTGAPVLSGSCWNLSISPGRASPLAICGNRPQHTRAPDSTGIRQRRELGWCITCSFLRAWREARFAKAPQALRAPWVHDRRTYASAGRQYGYQRMSKLPAVAGREETPRRIEGKGDGDVNTGRPDNPIYLKHKG